MKRLPLVVLWVVSLLLYTQTAAFAAETCSKEAVVRAVEQAIQILEKEGPAGLEKVGAIRFCGDNYLFVNVLKGKTLMHIKA
ncbi:MAG: hypothetical protein WAU91_05490, partial [Desulfatitalea sp.]